MDLKGHGLGELLHAGMRKGLDTKWSSLAWNAVHAMPPEVWAWWLSLAEKQVASWPQVARAEDVVWLLRWSERAHWEDPLYKTHRSWLALWGSILNQGGIDDLLGLTAWLNYCVNGP